jgi:WD40 repeat protein
MFRRSRSKTSVILVVGILLSVLATAALAAGPHFSTWSPAQKIDETAGNHVDLNTSAVDGCPMQSPDGLSLYMASNRPGGKGGLDIWVASRASASDPWGAPVDLPEPINSAADDFCPTAINGDGLLFVSRRTIEGVTCGLGDIYFSRRNPAHGWNEPQHLGCDPAGPNSALDEQGPSYVQARLYFSRSALPPGNTGELYVSEQNGDMSFGAATPIVELNDAGANDIQPNVRKDGREIVFSSTRAGGLGGPDIWSATRESVVDPWSAPVNLGPNVNTGLGESRPSLSRDAQQLLFGRAGPVGTGEGGTGASDIYVATRNQRDN